MFAGALALGMRVFSGGSFGKIPPAVTSKDQYKPGTGKKSKTRIMPGRKKSSRPQTRK
jgi:hypothetical protein